MRRSEGTDNAKGRVKMLKLLPLPNVSIRNLMGGNAHKDIPIIHLLAYNDCPFQRIDTTIKAAAESHKLIRLGVSPPEMRIGCRDRDCLSQYEFA